MVSASQVFVFQERGPDIDPPECTKKINKTNDI